MHRPGYLALHESGELARRIDRALAILGDCTVCPRDCHVDRLKDERKLCRVGRYAKVASFFAHFGEEDCLRGWCGSGTIFFSFCNLKCVFCQNWDVSNEGDGREVGPRELAHMMIELQRMGCHNINFVTPEHVVPQMLEALPYAIEGGLELPIVYNTSAYDSLHSLELLDGVVDIYMPDFKYWDESLSSRTLKARDYPSRARAAILEMHRQVGSLVVEDGLAVRGLLIRHLVMPGALAETEAIMRWIATELGTDTYVNVMDQYHPAGRVAEEPDRYSHLARSLHEDEFRSALALAKAAGLTRIDARRPHPKLRHRLVLAGY
jgi:putative pyruvate formate lyase activating enzyme